MKIHIDTTELFEWYIRIRGDLWLCGIAFFISILISVKIDDPKAMILTVGAGLGYQFQRLNLLTKLQDQKTCFANEISCSDLAQETHIGRLSLPEKKLLLDAFSFYYYMYTMRHEWLIFCIGHWGWTRSEIHTVLGQNSQWLDEWPDVRKLYKCNKHFTSEMDDIISIIKKKEDIQNENSQ